MIGTVIVLYTYRHIVRHLPYISKPVIKPLTTSPTSIHSSNTTTTTTTTQPQPQHYHNHNTTTTTTLPKPQHYHTSSLMPLTSIEWNGVFNSRPAERMFAEERIRLHYERMALEWSDVAKADVR
jgi:hypothetical protein